MNNIEGSFKNDYPFEKRKNEANRILNKFTDRIPVIVQISKKDNCLPILDKHKYLVPKDLTLGQFHFTIRKRMNLSSDKAIYFFFNNNIESNSNLMNFIYEKYKDEDDFLYTTLSSENTFGNNK